MSPLETLDPNLVKASLDHLSGIARDPEMQVLVHPLFEIRLNIYYRLEEGKRLIQGVENAFSSNMDDGWH